MRELGGRRAHPPASTLPIGVRIGMSSQFPVSVVLVGTRVTFWVLTAGIDNPVRGRDPSMSRHLSVRKVHRCARGSQQKTCEAGGPVRGSNLSTFRYLSAYDLNPCESVARGGYEIGGPVRGSDYGCFVIAWCAESGVSELVTLALSPLAPRVSWVLVEEARN